MDQNIKQQIVESINGTTNVLVTVSSNPTVDELAACIGLTLVLNKLGKHATAVFSGNIPSTLEFLKPDETLEDNTDSLRDFIIALDKSKADKLRYKVEDTVVKIFITPYKTSIGQKDLQFSQGDFNVDVVMALGVHKREELDKAITAHGRILHDATVVCINNKEVSNIGVYNWQDAESSSLCEMVVDLAETIHPDNFDAQTATALLTGIVAETARFSNEKTTPRTMSLSAKLMAAGANQQLVASKLQTNLTKSQLGLVEEEPEEKPAKEEDQDSGTLKIEHDNGDDRGSSAKDAAISGEEVDENDGTLEEEPLEKPPLPKQEKRLEPTSPPATIPTEPQAPIVQTPAPAPELPQPAMPAPTPQTPPASAPSTPSVQAPLQPASQISDVKTGNTEVPEPSVLSAPNQIKSGGSKLAYEPPVMGGTLTANSRPEPLDPPTDGLSMPTPSNAQILNHAPTQVGQDSGQPIIDKETVSHIEQTVGSPHADTAPPDLDALSQAAKAAAENDVNKDRLEPLVASGAAPLDMNVQDSAAAPQMPNVVPGSSIAPPAIGGLPPSANDIMGSMSQSAPDGLTPLPTPVDNLPPQIVPADPGLPPEQTASNATQPLAPPPVPPPFMPGTPPPTPGQQPPLPPAPGQ